jgi:hypothetical protein
VLMMLAPSFWVKSVPSRRLSDDGNVDFIMLNDVSETLIMHRAMQRITVYTAHNIHQPSSCIS